MWFSFLSFFFVLKKKKESKRSTFSIRFQFVFFSLCFSSRSIKIGNYVYYMESEKTMVWKKKRGSLIGLSGVKKACIDTRSKGCKQLLWRFLAAVVFVVGRKKGGVGTLVGWFLLCAPWVGVGNTPPTKRKSSKKQPPPATPPAFPSPPQTHTQEPPNPKLFHIL
jgi:hypothetical protein